MTTSTPSEATAAPLAPTMRGWLHLVGAAIVVASAPLLVLATSDPALRAGVIVYVLGVAGMLATSATYHVPAWRPAVKRILRRADHSAIFLAIAGTYTPIVLAVFPSGWNAALLAMVWVGAGVGMLVRNVFHDIRPWAQAVPYVVLGWMAVLGIPALWAYSPTVTWFVAMGGVFYTIGAVVFAVRRPNPWPRTFGHHEVFHALTLVAIALHWVGVRVAVAG
jgi:hemolysin III